jgi:VCBS repeat-containing protein
VGARIAYHIADSLTDAPFRLGGFDSFSLGGTDARAEGAVTIPDAHLLFNAEFKKLGYDLLLVGDDGKTFIVHDYFKSDERATLMAPSGASLAGRLVSLLAGAEQNVQEAQAGAGAATAPIGRVEKVSGTCTIIRNGVAIAANQGDVVLKGDVLQTAQGSSLGVAFLDGTAFFLSASARMAVTELVYTPNGTNNSAFMSIVQGTVTFVAGQVAKTGDMKVDTPVATMGIRGTAVFVQIGANDGTGKFAVLTERGGETGTFQLFDKAGNFIGNVSSSSLATQISGAGIGQIQILQVPLSPAEQQIAQGLLNQVYDVIQSFQQGPQLTPREGTAPGAGSSGSSSPNDPDLLHNPILEVNPPQLQLTNNGPGSTQNNQLLADQQVTVAHTSFEKTAIEGGTIVAGALFSGVGLPPIYSLVGPPPPGLLFNSDGTYNFDPTVSAYDHLAQGTVQQIDVSYVGTVNGTVVEQGVLHLTVTGTNDAPVAFAIVETVAEGAAAAPGQLLALDVDDNTTLTFSIVGELPPGLVLNPNGSFTFDAANAAYDHLAVGEQQEFHFTYQVTDEFGASSEAEATITVTGTNDVPVITGGTTTGDFTPGGQQGGGGGEGGAAVAAAAAAAGSVTDNTLVNGLGGSAGFGEQSLAANDDGSTGAIDITSVFGAQGINFFGHYYTSIYINNNGNITFNSPTGQFTPSQITAGAGNPIIAPFWADVDTRGSHSNTPTPGGNSTGSNLVYWDFDTVNGVFTVTWDDVGFYSGHTNHLNAFQLQLINRGNGDFDIVFRYEDVTWTTGQASGGDNDGLGGSIARAGYSAGDGVHYFELPQSGDQVGMLALEATTGNTGVTGVDEFQVRNGTVVTDPTTSGVINFDDVDLSDTHTATAVFAGEGSALGTLTVQVVHDTTGTGTGGQVAWDYSIDPDLLAGLGANDTLIETFNVFISDGHGGTATQPVTITLHGVNDAPVAVGDSYSANEDAQLVIPATTGVLTNDTDLDGDSLTALLVAGPQHGSLALNPDGSFTYTPDADYNGGDSFTYRASDGASQSAVTTVNLTVNPVSDAPAGNGDSYVLNEDTTLTVAGPGVLGNDTDADGDPLSATLVNGPSHGVLTLNADGSFTYTPAQDFNGADSFTYRASDGANESAVTTVNLSVNPVNDPPAGVGDSYFTSEDTALVIPAPGVLGNDTDVDDIDLSSILVQAPSHGALTLNPNGSFTYTPDANFTGNDSFTYRANDGTDDSAVTTVSLTIGPVNDDPTANNDSFGATEDQSLVLTAAQLLANDSIAPDTGETLTIQSVQDAQHGLVAFNASTNQVTFTPDANYFGPASFTYTISDGNGGTSTATVNLTIANVNDNPAANNDSFNATEDQSLVLTATQLLANDSIVPDTGETLTIQSVQGAQHGSVVFNANTNQVTFTPDANYFGPASFTYTIADGNGGTSTATVNLTVAAVNDAPVGVVDNYTTDEDTALTIPAPGVLANDTDIDSIDLSAILVSGPSHGTLTLNANGSFTYTPSQDYNGSDSFTYRASDGAAQSSITTVNLTVNPVADPPINHVPGAQHVNEDASLAFSGANAISISAESGFETVTLSVQNGTLKLGTTSGLIVSGNETGTLILGGTIADINAALAGLTYKPYQNFNGSDTLQIKTTDNIGTDIDTVAITVDSINDAPIIFAPSQMSYWTNNSVGNVTPIDNIIFADADSGSDSVTVTLALDPQSGVLNAQDLANDGVTVTSSQSGSTLTLVGSIAAINAYIAGDNIFFDPPGESLADRELTISIDDGGHNGGGGSKTATTTSVLHSVSFSFGPGNDNIDLHNVSLDSLPIIDLKGDISGNTLVTSSSNNPQGAAIHYEANDTGGFDTVTMVFTPDQLSEILATTAARDELQSYLDGNPGVGGSADTLNLSNTSWHAIVDGAEIAQVALKAGDDFVIDNAITNDLPDFRSNQLGTPGNDTLVATATTPNLIGVNGGGNGHDILVATIGGSQLDGGAGNDLLLGRAGADRLVGGLGSDILAGGRGSDTFAFTAATTGSADLDVIVDFQHGEDVLEISTAMFASFSDLLKNARASSDGQDTIIKLGNHDIITLKNTPIGVLTPQDFHFVTISGDMLHA